MDRPPQPGGAAANYDVGTYWSLGHSPNTGNDAIFDPNQPGGTNTPCYIAANSVEPTVQDIYFRDWAGTLTLNSDLSANLISINPRTGNPGTSEIIINQGSNLNALQALYWSGGQVAGAGTFVVAGTDTINGTNAADKPTLGAMMQLNGNLTFWNGTQPLVVQGDNTNISVNGGGSITFQAQGVQGEATAISNGDTLSHSLIVNGGTITRNNLCELFVCMGLDVESGQVNVTNPTGQNSGNPLHFTGKNADGTGLNVSGGSVNLNGDMTADAGGNIEGGTVTVSQWNGGSATLTLGINANSPRSELVNTGNLVLQGTIFAHGGGFYMDGGNLNSAGAGNANFILDTGSTFDLYGGEIDITDPAEQSATGVLHLVGNLAANGGRIVDNVNSSNGTHGYFDVAGNGTLTTDTIFSSIDLNPNANNVDMNWLLMGLSANPQGDFFYEIPLNRTSKPWNKGFLFIYEP